MRKKGWKRRKITIKNLYNYLEAIYQYIIQNRDIVKIANKRRELILQKSPECLQTRAYCDNESCSDEGLYNEKCKVCLKGYYTFAPGKRCVHCGCDMEEKLFQIQGCEKGCFPSRNKQTTNIW